MKLIIKYKGVYQRLEELLSRCGRMDVSAEVFVAIGQDLVPIEEYMEQIIEREDHKTAIRLRNMVEDTIAKGKAFGQFLYEHRN